MGGEGNDWLIGGWGDDTLMGGEGDDKLMGGWGDDTLKGGKGDDYLDGNWGDDTLKGGKGDDYLNGGRGADTFVFREGDGHDTIAYFGFGWAGEDEYHPTYEGFMAAREIAIRNGHVDVIQLHLNLPTGTSDEDAFDTLEIRKDGRNTVIEYGNAGDTITLEKVSPDSVTVDDFDFVLVG